MSKVPRWPPLPRQVEGPLGPVSVVLCPELLEHSRLGTFEMAHRRIRVASSLRPDMQYCTMYHEFVEMALSDAGLINILDGKKLGRIKEAVCDAVSVALLAQFKHERGL